MDCEWLWCYSIFALRCVAAAECRSGDGFNVEWIRWEGIKSGSVRRENCLRGGEVYGRGGSGILREV